MWLLSSISSKDADVVKSDTPTELLLSPAVVALHAQFFFTGAHDTAQNFDLRDAVPPFFFSGPEDSIPSLVPVPVAVSSTSAPLDCTVSLYEWKVEQPTRDVYYLS